MEVVAQTYSDIKKIGDIMGYDPEGFYCHYCGSGNVQKQRTNIVLEIEAGEETVSGSFSVKAYYIVQCSDCQTTYYIDRNGDFIGPVC